MSVWQLLLAIAGGMAAMMMALPPAWRLLKGIARIPLAVDAIAHEFAPNSGHSMRDSINRVEAAVGELADWSALHAERDDKFEGYMHQRMHDLFGEMTVLRGVMDLPPASADKFRDDAWTRRTPPEGAG